MTDILMDGRKEELLSVLAEMKKMKEVLVLKTLVRNEALEAFEPIIQERASLWAI
jgi:hypothetical protein